MSSASRACPGSVVSAENVALVTSLYPSPADDVTELVNDDAAASRLREAFGLAFDPAVECTMGFPGEMRVAYTGRGLAGLRAAWQDWLKHWASFHTQVEEVRDGGDRVVVVQRIQGRRRLDGPEETLRRATVWTIRDKRIIHVDFNVSPDQALAAVQGPA